MSLKARIQDDVKAAMRAQDKRRLGALRLVSAAIKQREVDERIELDDSQVVAVLRKMLKQRQDSLTQFRAGGRDDLADQEAFEIALIEGYLPQALGAGDRADGVQAGKVLQGGQPVEFRGDLLGPVVALAMQAQDQRPGAPCLVLGSVEEGERRALGQAVNRERAAQKVRHRPRAATGRCP